MCFYLSWMLKHVNTFSRDSDSYDYGDETTDDIDYEYDWSEREEVTTTTANINIDENIENIGVEIRVGSHIDENNGTTVINDNTTKNSSNNSDVEVEYSVNLEKPTQIAKERSIESHGFEEKSHLKIIPIVSAIKQTTARSNGIETSQINTYSSNRSLSVQYHDSNNDSINSGNFSLITDFKLTTNVTSDQNLPDMSNLQEKMSLIPVQNLSLLVNTSRTTTTNIVKDYVYQNNKTAVANENPMNNSPVDTSEIEYIVGENESSVLYADSDEPSGITSDPHPRMLTEDLSNLAKVLNDSSTSLSPAETRFHKDSSKKDMVNSVLNIITLPTASEESNPIISVDSTTMSSNDMKTEFSASDELSNSDFVSLTTTDMNVDQDLGPENNVFPNQNISMNQQEPAENLEVNEISRTTEVSTTNSLDDPISNDTTTNNIQDSYGENDFIEKNDSTTLLPKINITVEKFDEMKNHSRGREISLSTEMPDTEDYLTAPEFYYSSDDYSSKYHFSNNFTTERNIMNGSPTYNYDGDEIQNNDTLIQDSDFILPKTNSVTLNDAEKKLTIEMWNVDDSSDDPAYYYLENGSPTKVNSLEGTATVDNSDISTRLRDQGFEITTLSNQAYSEPYINTPTITEELNTKKNYSSQKDIKSHYVDDKNFQAEKSTHNDDDLEEIKFHNWDASKSILLSKLFKESGVSDHEDVKYEATSTMYLDSDLKKDDADKVVSLNGTMGHFNATEYSYKIADEEEETTIYPTRLQIVTTDESLTTNPKMDEEKFNLTDKISDTIYNKTVFLTTTYSPEPNSFKDNISYTNNIDIKQSSNKSISMQKIIYDKHLDDIDAINITTEVNIQSKYSYPDVEDQIYYNLEESKKQNIKIGTLETNYENRSTTDFDDQNFIFDENIISNKKKHIQGESTETLDTEVVFDSRDRHQPGIKPPK